MKQEDFNNLAEDVWVPALAEMMAAMMSDALGSGKGAAQARAAILDRLLGKATEQVKQETRQEIIITIAPLGGVVEGESRVLELAGPAGDSDEPRDAQLGRLLAAAMRDSKEPG